MSKSEQKQQVFDALVTNGLDFIERSAHELVDQQKFAIAHFATGLELLLKARLFHEHWTLIEVSPHKANWKQIIEGTAHTIQASALCATIASTTGTPLNRQKDTFDAVFKHRNRVLHAFPGADLQETVAEQCRAWMHLSGLMSNEWADVFNTYQDRLKLVEESLRVYHEHLQVRYEQLESRLQGPRAEDRLLKCPACGFESTVIPSVQGRSQPAACEVCGYKEEHALRFSCGAWILANSVGWVQCPCGTTHQLQEFIDDLTPDEVPPLTALIGCETVLEWFDPTPELRPKDMLHYEGHRAHCGECNSWQPTAVPFNGGYLCVECAAVLDDENPSHCEYCNTPWVSYNTEYTYMTGCEMCDGAYK